MWVSASISKHRAESSAEAFLNFLLGVGGRDADEEQKGEAGEAARKLEKADGG
jgi:hypothetical protein